MQSVRGSKKSYQQLLRASAEGTKILLVGKTIQLSKNQRNVIVLVGMLPCRTSR